MSASITGDKDGITITVNGQSATLSGDEALSFLAQGYMQLRAVQGLALKDLPMPDPASMYQAVDWQVALPDSSPLSTNPSEIGAWVMLRLDPIGWGCRALTPQECQSLAKWFAGVHEVQSPSPPEATKH
jgi:hypothetical protein